MRLLTTVIAAGMILLGSSAVFAVDAPAQKRIRPVQRRSVQKLRPVQKSVRKSVQKPHQKSVQKPTQKPTQKGRRRGGRRHRR